MAQQADNPLQDARAHILQAIADLRAANIAVPTALFRACHALSFATDKPAAAVFNGAGHAGASS